MRNRSPAKSPPPHRRSLVLSACLFAFTVAGCVSGAPDEEPDEEPDAAPATELSGEVEWWTINMQVNYGEYIDGMIEEYEQQNPDVTIKVVDVPGADMGTKLLAALAAGTPPDVVMVNSLDLGPARDAMTDLTDYLSPEDVGVFQESLVEPLKDDDKLTAVPWFNGGTPVAIYRGSAMEGTSFDPENPPTTYDQFLDLAEEVKAKSGIAGTNSIPSAAVMPYYGVEMVNEDRTAAAFNTPETVEILERWKAAYDSGAIAPGAVSKDIRNLPENLENRRIGFLTNITAAQMIYTRSNAPEVFEDLAVAPGARTPEGKLLLASHNTLAIPSNSDNKAAAADWLKFVSNAENQLELCKIVAIFPSTPETLEDPFFTTPGDTAMDDARKLFVEEAGDLVSGEMATGKDAQLANLFDEQVRAFLQGDADAQTALDTAEQQWNAELAT